jgi:hypothetical protein
MLTPRIVWKIDNMEVRLQCTKLDARRYHEHGNQNPEKAFTQQLFNCISWIFKIVSSFQVEEIFI